MKEPLEQKLRLIINGAISLYEGECLEIPALLSKQERPDLSEAYDAIGAALYWMKQLFENESMSGTKSLLP